MTIYCRTTIYLQKAAGAREKKRTNNKHMSVSMFVRLKFNLI